MENNNLEKPKKELSPETVLKTMEKVFDIDTKDTAYSSIIGFSDAGFHDTSMENAEGKEEAKKYWKNLIEKIQKILNQGLIGISSEDMDEMEGKPKHIKEKYIEHLKKKGNFQSIRLCQYRRSFEIGG